MNYKIEPYTNEDFQEVSLPTPFPPRPITQESQSLFQLKASRVLLEFQWTQETILTIRNYHEDKYSVLKKT